MKSVETFTINDTSFVAMEYDFDQGWPLFLKIFKICGRPFLTFLLEGLDGLIKDMLGGELSKEQALKMDVTEVISKIDRAKVIESFTSLLDRIEPEMLMPLTQEILSTTEIVDGDKSRRKIDFNRDFKGKYGLVMKLLRKVLVLQYSDSFQGLLSGLSVPNKSAVTQPNARVVAR